MSETEKNSKPTRKKSSTKKTSSRRLISKTNADLLFESSPSPTDLNLVENKIEQLSQDSVPEKEPIDQIEKKNKETKLDDLLQYEVTHSEPPLNKTSPLSTASFSSKEKEKGENSSDSEKKEKSMNTAPNPHVNTLKKNIEKQSQEQRSVQKILSVFLFSFFTLIVFVLILAVYGGMVIFKKIHSQDVLITEAEKKLQNRIDQLNSLFFQQKKEIEELDTSLNQIHSYITDTEKDLSKTRSRLDNLDSKIADNAQKIQQLSTEIKQDNQSRLKKEDLLLKRITILEEERKKNGNETKKSKSSSSP
ncbi:hypothetical protein IT6_04305 [Methylacidiphilum caldifontis]|uniref:hypothetical protein n=1 Tax=Methylacidiphilum caldifontis TaxID=2795386 RepID=UPI001A90B478|nr:hypothetical protein [Methylacidiphilum caldifontis]QSR89505.1 hypothetical protein IT6_04305 [Methylacidiphilum caldifontis]